MPTQPPLFRADSPSAPSRPRVSDIVWAGSSLCCALEPVTHPRWHAPAHATKRAVGGAPLLLSAGLLVLVPLSNLPVGPTIILVDFTCLEEDRVFLAVTVLVVLVLLAVALGALWATVVGMS